MSGLPCSASAAELAHDADVMRRPDHHPHLESAREDLIERLVDGKNVHRENARTIFAAALEDDIERERLLDLLDGLPRANETARGFVARFVDAHPDWIEWRATEIAYEREDDHGDC